MKKLLIPFILVAAVLFQSCKGPQGEPGPNGEAIIGQTFEVEGVNFTAANEFSYTLTFNAARFVDVRESDAVLIYILWATSNGNPIWRLLPQAIDMPRGITYNFDHTPTDFQVFIDAPVNVNLSTLSNTVTQNQTLRVVVIPSDFTSARTSGSALDVSNYEAVKKYYNLDESKIPAVVAN